MLEFVFKKILHSPLRKSGQNVTREFSEAGSIDEMKTCDTNKILSTAERADTNDTEGSKDSRYGRKEISDMPERRLGYF